MNEQIETANENIGTMLYIMLGRVYDLLVLMCDANGKSEEVLNIIELHKNGMLMCPLPSLSIPEDINIPEDNDVSPDIEQNQQIE